MVDCTVTRSDVELRRCGTVHVSLSKLMSALGHLLYTVLGVQRCCSYRYPLNGYVPCRHSCVVRQCLLAVEMHVES
jgi:hypothetical protein